jgi:hypothetical protein
MIEFVTLYLGLVLGVQPLEVSVGPEVASVEILLDAEPVKTLQGEPWQLSFDFGARLIPHHLEAIARDSAGDELARAEQWINLPRPRAEAKLSLEADEEGSRRWARVIWEAIDFDGPRKLEAFLDGRALKVESLDRIELPKTDPDFIHFLTAELEFSDTVSAHAEVVFGGTYGDEVSSELTSIVLESDRSRPPKTEQLQGRILHRGKPLRVVAVERPPIELIVVREHSTGMFESIQRLITTGSAQRLPMRARLPRILRPADRVRFALTATSDQRAATGRYEQIPVTRDLTQPRAATLLQILMRIGPVGSRQALTNERIADAVSIAGLVGSASNRRRAVILLSAFQNEDVSRLVPAAVRDYLNSLMVPLVVWELKPPGERNRPPATRWGKSVDVTDWGGMGTAFEELRKSLDSQVLVWVEGRQLQREISIAPGASGLRLAQRNSPELEAELQRLSAAGDLVQSRADLPSPDVAGSPSGPQLTLLDAQQLARARRLLGAPEISVPLGQINLITDANSPRVWKSLERLGQQVPELYSVHYELPVTLDSGAVVVLFADEEAFRTYEKEIGIAAGELTGHASPGLVVLYSGERSPQEVSDTFTHELVHLLTLRALGPELPVWLDEGLAESMTFATNLRSGSLALGPLDPRRLRAAASGSITGPLSLIEKMAEDSERGRLPLLEDLVELEREVFMRAENREVLYALSALWVHYLGTVDADHKPAFRRYLKALAAGEEDTENAGSPATFLDADSEALEAEFRSWLRWLATELSRR